MDGAGATCSSALDQRDVSLVRWYLTSPSSVAAALRTPCRKQNNNDDDEALASRLASSIPTHLQFFATVVMDFGPFHVPTEEENQRFDALQHIYHDDLSGNAPSPTIMRLSPRMILDYAEPKSKRRDALGEVVNEYLDTLARAVEGQLLDEVDKETSKRHSKEERERRRRRAKKKKNRSAKQKYASDEADVESSPSSDAEKATSCDDENTTPNEGCKGTISDDAKNLTKGRGSNDQIQITAVKDAKDAKDLRKTWSSCGESEQLPSKGETKSKKISYLAAAAKVPKTKSRPKPSVAIVTHPLPRPSADSKQPHAAQTNESMAETEQEAIARLQEQLEAQRKGHLDLIQQVQLKAYIAENKAAMALDRSRKLERQILDALYPEIEATRVESSSVKEGPWKGKSSNAGDKLKTKEDLELELRTQRRENLAMMNRVQMRTFLAETKAKAAEQRSQQMEKLLRDAQKGEEFA